MPRYWASLERAVSNEKAPVSAQLCSNWSGTDSLVPAAVVAKALRHGPAEPGLLQNCNGFRKSKAGGQPCSKHEQCHSLVRDRAGQIGFFVFPIFAAIRAIQKLEQNQNIFEFDGSHTGSGRGSDRRRAMGSRVYESAILPKGAPRRGQR